MMKNLKQLRKLQRNIRNETLILFWQFTIKTLDELDIVSNQNFSIEMFLIRLIYLKEISNTSEIIDQNDVLKETKINNEDDSINMKSLSNENNDFFDLKKKQSTRLKMLFKRNIQNMKQIKKNNNLKNL